MFPKQIIPVLFLLLISITTQARDINSDLIKAIEKGDTDTAKALLAKGASPNAKDWRDYTALMYAAKGGQTDIVKILLSKGAVVDAQSNIGTTALMQVANTSDYPSSTCKHIEIVELLINKGADLKLKSFSLGYGSIRHNADTLLMFAAHSAHNPVIEILLKHGADPNEASGSAGETPLMFLAKNRFWISTTESVIALLKSGAKVDAKDSSGRTALMFAAESGQADIVKTLLGKGADPKTKDKDGKTALMMAAERGDFTEEALKLLLDKGAELNAKDNNGKTALMIANEKGHKALVQLFKSAGAKEY